MQAWWWPFPATLFNIFLFIVFPLVFVVWLAYRTCTSQAIPKGYARSQPPPADGSDGISSAYAADISYFPGERGSSKGGFPVSGMGPSGRGSYGSRPHDKDE